MASRAPGATGHAIKRDVSRRTRSPAATCPALPPDKQQLLELVMGLLGKPQVLLVDEPSMGLAPTAVAEVWATLADIRRAGTTILLVEQSARKALALADRGLALDLGDVRRDAPAASLLEDPEIRRLCLGG